MSRVGRRPIPIPNGVTVDVAGGVVHVKGPKGTLSESIPRAIGVAVSDGGVVVSRADDRGPSRALHGLARALVANMVRGVTEQFARELEIQGVGYRADVQGRKLTLQLGYSHPIEMAIPTGLTVAVDRNVVIKIQGADKHQVGQFAADVRALRPPEPYKGKGIRYVGEHVRRKVGKAGATGG